MENISVKLKILKQEIPHRNDDPCRSQCRCSVLTCLHCLPTTRASLSNVKSPLLVYLPLPYTVNCEVQVPSNSYPTFKFPPKDVVSQPGRKIFSCFLSTLWKQFTDSCLIKVYNHIANHNLSHSVVNLRYQ